MNGMTLNIEPNIASPDEFYQALLDAHRGLTTEESQGLNARLILLLANHIGDPGVLRDALQRAHPGADVVMGVPASPVHSISPLDREGHS
jgi:hypothetical protein